MTVDFACRGIQVWETATGKPLTVIPEKGFGRVIFSPDGRTIVVVGDDDIHAWDAVTGEEVYRQPVGDRLLNSYNTPAAFSPDGNRLVVGCTDTTAVVWDLSSARRRAGSARPLTAKGRDALWDDLAGDDAAKAYAAIDRLAAQPGDGIALLRERLRPAVGVPQDKFKRLLAALDADDFEARESAARQLADLEEQLDGRLARRPGRRPDGRTEGPHRGHSEGVGRRAVGGNASRSPGRSGAGLGRYAGGPRGAGEAGRRGGRRPTHPHGAGGPGSIAAPPPPDPGTIRPRRSLKPNRTGPRPARPGGLVDRPTGPAGRPNVPGSEPMMRTAACALLVVGAFAVAATAADKAAKNQMVKGTIKSVDPDTSVLVVNQKVKDEVVERQLDISDSTEIEVVSDAGTDTGTGKAGLQLLVGKEGASVKVKCDKDVNVLKVTVMVKK